MVRTLYLSIHHTKTPIINLFKLLGQEHKSDFMIAGKAKVKLYIYSGYESDQILTSYFICFIWF